MATCARCGAPLQGIFCGECGHRAEPAHVASPPPPPSERVPPTRVLREARRPEPSPFVVRVDGPFAEGSTVIVGAGDAFVAERFGACGALLGPGQSPLDEEADAGWFVRDRLELTFEELLGELEDVRGARARVGARGTVRLVIDEPRDFVAGLLADGGAAPDVEQVAAALRAKLAELIGEQVRTLLAKGRYFTTLHSTQAVDEIRNEVRETYSGDAARNPATSIELLKLKLGTEAVEANEPAPAPPSPAPAPASSVAPPAPSVAPPPAPEPPRARPWASGDRVRVVWTDGRKYPGVVRTVACLVAFEDGQEQWIPLDAMERDG